ALVTYDNVTPAHTTIDFHTLYFGNNDGSNYSMTVSPAVGIEDPVVDYGIVRTSETITVGNTDRLKAIELISIDGKIVNSVATKGFSERLDVSSLPTGVYVLRLIGNDLSSSIKLSIN
ncbi:MAG: T9SS type A sorting domain-containing protein, partial [Flavobacteriales bacterium]|nr:T9SS type A sorting domain-containing protein [Flavobacteriales bacterium]